jgi:hypothetical protein
LPEEWQIVEIDCHTVHVEPIEPDGRRIRFGFGRYGAKDRLSVCGQWPRSKDHHEFGPRNADATVESISVARGRPAKVAAADIQRRYIEPYTDLWPVCAARAREHDRQQDRQFEILRRLASITDPDFEANERSRVARGANALVTRGCGRYHAYRCGVSKIDVQSDGMVQIETDHRLSAELAEKVLRLITAEFTPDKGENEDGDDS